VSELSVTAYNQELFISHFR